MRIWARFALSVGGAYGSQGTVYSSTPSGGEMVLHSFGKGADGMLP